MILAAEMQMNIKEAKSLLERYIDNRDKIAELRLEILEAEEREKSAASQKLTFAPGGSGKKNDISDYMVLIEKLNQEISKAAEENFKVDVTLARMSGIHRKMLSMHYRDGIKWDAVDEQLGKCYQWSVHSLSKALKSFSMCVH